jgi:hypothetical protein
MSLAGSRLQDLEPDVRGELALTTPSRSLSGTRTAMLKLR